MIALAIAAAIGFAIGRFSTVVRPRRYRLPLPSDRTVQLDGLRRR